MDCPRMSRPQRPGLAFGGAGGGLLRSGGFMMIPRPDFGRRVRVHDLQIFVFGKAFWHSGPETDPQTLGFPATACGVKMNQFR